MYTLILINLLVSIYSIRHWMITGNPFEKEDEQVKAIDIIGIVSNFITLIAIIVFIVIYLP